MLLLKWIRRLLCDIIRHGFANRSMGMSLAIIILLVLGLVIIGTHVSAPFIYTLF